jgi:hypothetical protein
MKEVNPKTRALILLTLALMTTACGKGTSKSSSNQYSPDPPDNKPIENNLDPVELSSSNYTQVASQSLKSLLLNDAGSNALSQSVTVTTGQNSEIVDRVTGVVITLAPYPCIRGGDFNLRATVNNTNNNVQLDLNSPLQMALDARFNGCVLDSNSLDGDVSMTFDTNLSQLLGGPMFNLNAHVDVQGLSVEQLHLPDFVFDGIFDYKVSNTDGINVNMEVQSRNSVYFADQSYQLFEFDLLKSVNNLTQAYSYSISSEFTDSLNPNAYVAYETQQPLTGIGFAPPTAGRLAVYGSNGTILIHALREQNILVQLDLGDDGVIDNQYHTTWEELVFNSFGATPN